MANYCRAGIKSLRGTVPLETIEDVFKYKTSELKLYKLDKFTQFSLFHLLTIQYSLWPSNQWPLDQLVATLAVLNSHDERSAIKIYGYLKHLSILVSDHEVPSSGFLANNRLVTKSTDHQISEPFVIWSSEDLFFYIFFGGIFLYFFSYIERPVHVDI